MPIIAEKTNNVEFEKLKNGTYQSVCIGVYDIGFEKSVFQGEEKLLHKIIILWEVNERIKEGEFAGKRFMVSKMYTLSFSDKANLRRDLESWAGKPFGIEMLSFDVEKVVGLNCLLNIVQNKNGYPTILSITPLMNGMQAIVRESENGYIPDWIRKKVENKINNISTKNKVDNLSEIFEGSRYNDSDIPF